VRVIYVFGPRPSLTATPFIPSPSSFLFSSSTSTRPFPPGLLNTMGRFTPWRTEPGNNEPGNVDTPATDSPQGQDSNKPKKWNLGILSDPLTDEVPGTTARPVSADCGLAY
jgi:hypothetical protein